MQNLLIVNVPHANAAPLAKEPTLDSLLKANRSSAERSLAADGFCKLAITETKGFSRWLTEELDDRLPGFDQELKLHVTGCPNSCGQHWIAKMDSRQKDQSQRKARRRVLLLPGWCGRGQLQSIARPVGYRCASQEVPEAIERLLGQYQLMREPGENLRQFFGRHSTEEIRQFLAGGTDSGRGAGLATGPRAAWS